MSVLGKGSPRDRIPIEPAGKRSIVESRAGSPLKRCQSRIRLGALPHYSAIYGLAVRVPHLRQTRSVAIDDS
jgi:hypothetical protein